MRNCCHCSKQSSDSHSPTCQSGFGAAAGSSGRKAVKVDALRQSEPRLISCVSIPTMPPFAFQNLIKALVGPVILSVILPVRKGEKGKGEVADPCTLIFSQKPSNHFSPCVTKLTRVHHRPRPGFKKHRLGPVAQFTSSNGEKRREWKRAHCIRAILLPAASRISRMRRSPPTAAISAVTGPRSAR